MKMFFLFFSSFGEPLFKQVFVQWGQEVTETLLSQNYFSARELTLAHPAQTVFMRNIRSVRQAPYSVLMSFWVGSESSCM